MYYEDLTAYDYGYTLFSNALNVGWLEKGHPFSKGNFPKKQQVIDKLKSMKRQNICRGVHLCDFCKKEIGNGEYIIEGDKIYSAPVLIIHYIEIHNYKPSQEFIDALLK